MINVLTCRSTDGSQNGYCVMDNHSRRTLVIDPSMAVEPMLAELARLHGRVEAILLTHGHFDHIQSVEKLAQACSCPVYIHQADAAMLGDAKANLSHYVGHAIRMNITPITFNQDDVLPLANLQVQCLHIGGHTAGSTAFLINSGLFCGDAIFADSIGRTDFPGGDYTQLRDNICKKLLTLPDSVFVYPGHNAQTTIGRVKAENPYIIAMGAE